MISVGKIVRYALVLASATVFANAASAASIDFEEFGSQPTLFLDQIPLTTQYQPQGVTFAGGWEILDQDSSFGLPARSGRNFVAFATGVGSSNTLTMSFATPMSVISSYVGARSPVTWTLTAFLNQATVGTATVMNAAGAYALLGFSGAFDSVTIASSGSAGVLDDLSFEAAAIPLPGAGLLLLGGMGGLVALRRRAQRTT